MAMDADFGGYEKPRHPGPPHKRERNDRHLVKPLGPSEDIPLFEELVRIVNEAQGRDAADERRLYGPMRVSGPSFRNQRRNSGSQF
jgi:hypothetical protein